MSTSTTPAATGPTRLPAPRVLLVALAAVVQLVIVGIAVAPQLSARLTGDEYLLRIAPLDPIDPFRGAYVTLDYPDLRLVPEGGLPAGVRDEDTVFVPLVRDGEVWTGGTPVAEAPEGPYLRCHNPSDWRLECGIDSFFLPQDEALAAERAVGSGDALARVRVDGRGNAAVVGIELPDGTSY